MTEEIIKCGDCWAHYPNGTLHICDGLMKALVTKHRNEHADDCKHCGYPKNINGQHWGEQINADDSAEQ